MLWAKTLKMRRLYALGLTALLAVAINLLLIQYCGFRSGVWYAPQGFISALIAMTIAQLISIADAKLKDREERKECPK